MIKKIILLFLGFLGFLLMFFYGFNILGSSFLHLPSFFLFVHALLEQHYYLAVLTYCFVAFLVSACALPGSSFVIITGGMLFGFFPGFLYALLSLSAGSTLLFFVSRYFLQNFFYEKYAHYMNQINCDILWFGHFYIFIMRGLMIFPFSLGTIFASLTAVPSVVFIAANFFGMIPGLIFYVAAGSQFGAFSCWYSLVSGSTLFIGLKCILLPLLIKVMRFIRLRYSKSQVSA